jgi:hypothetical protein
MDVHLFESRTFSMANAASLLLAVGFFAITIGSVLFLTTVWHWSILKTGGLAICPGALFGTLFGAPAGRIAERRGALGVALVVGIVGSPSAANALDRTHAAFEVAIVALALSCAVALLMKAPVAEPADVKLAPAGAE